MRWCVWRMAANIDVDILPGRQFCGSLARQKAKREDAYRFQVYLLEYGGSRRNLHPPSMARFSFVLDVLNSIVVN